MNHWRSKYLWAPLGVAWFELRRSFSPGRLSLWFLVAFFPMLLTAMVRVQAGEDVPNEAVVVMLFILVIRVACVMGLLLWATPLVSNEIEGKTWIYIVTRPHGSLGIVLGKFLIAILWSLTAGLVASTSAVLVSGVDDMMRTWMVLSSLVVLGCLAYGGLFTLIGAMVQRRAMVVAIIYAVIVEGVLTLVPATINRFTIGYRLSALMLQWMGYTEGENRDRYELFFDAAAPHYHVILLLLLTAGLLVGAIFRVRQGSYLTEAET
jgi:ABC-type transport system involved in multi-copper enzyme maturation permease subunit